MPYDKHVERVRQFMMLAGQTLPEWPISPSDDVRLLRSRLILEEALETIQALGVQLQLHGHTVDFDVVQFQVAGNVDLPGVADGCADVHVVTTGTSLACGIDPDSVQDLVDVANLRKFGPGGYRDPLTGKWRKPPDFQPPDVARLLRAHGWNESN